MNPSDTSSTTDPTAADSTIRLALPSKGHLYEGVVEILKRAGYKVRRASDRQYEATIAGHPRFHVVFMRPTDIVTQVEEGRCHLGVTGMDLYAERAFEAEASTVVVEDLGYGGCRLVVAVPESWVDVTHIIDLVDLTDEFKRSGRTFRVSTKYPALTEAYFRRWGIYTYQIIDSDGALELHPTLGIADIIVDLTSSGVTLKDNRLREIDGGRVLDSASCLIGHAPTLSRLVAEGEAGPLALLLDAMDGVRASDGMLHLEAVGQPRANQPGTDADTAALDRTADAVVRFLAERGAQHPFRGEVRDDAGRPGWRVSALIAARRFPACHRGLMALGATRIVGLPTQFVFDRTMTTTFGALRDRLGVPASAGR